MKFRGLFLCGAASLVVIAGPASAATIKLIDLGGVAGSAAEQGFNIAADYWGKMFTNNVTINLGVKFAPLPTNVIGSTSSSSMDISVANWETLWNASKSGSTLDSTAVLPTLNGSGGINNITAGTDINGDNLNNVSVFDPGNNVASQVLYTNTSTVKAIGGTASYSSSNPQKLDGSVTFSSTFGFDFNPSDGVNANTFDFIGVAIHEIGHALGFVSGVDFFDYYGGPSGPGYGALGYDLNDTSIFTALDMFRYSADSAAQDAVDFTVGGTKYFSIDGGATAVFDNTFATGQYSGDGRQASHWKDTAGCQVGNGIMDPTFCFGQRGVITALDLAAFDAIGWNLSLDPLVPVSGGSSTTADGKILVLDASTPTYYRQNTGDLYKIYVFGSVPEPASWAMMMLGFGAIGATMRRRKVRMTVGYAKA